LDGWGVAPVWGGNAIAQANVPNFNGYCREFPYTTLSASGEAVGLPHGSPGNSEAGHLNIGAGEIVHQDQPIIDESIRSGNFFNNAILLGAVDHARKNNSSLHIMGLLSETGIHSHINHMKALLELCKQQNFDRVFLHLFADGRDSDTISGIELLNKVESWTKEVGIGNVVSVVGRYYAMDRDNRWERVAKAYRLLSEGVGVDYPVSGAIFSRSYASGITDEFIEPSFVKSKDRHVEFVKDNDAVIFFNFRADRARELSQAFLDPDLKEIHGRTMRKNLYFSTFVMHDERVLGKAAFTPGRVLDPIAHIWSEKGFKQFHTAETEKYAHVTYFFNGSREEPFPGEDRILIPSPKSVKTYDQMPEMSAKVVADTVIKAIKRNYYDTIVVNFANPDMVGHSGDLKATIKAVEVVDECLGAVIKEVLAVNGAAFVFADHGNAEQMVNPITLSPDTEHTTNPVPFILISNHYKKADIQLKKDCSLSSIVPTCLDLMKIPYNKEEKATSILI
ncbi:MAG TPA: 2,3-bisphosphoglycerate-independent phosphoglycerate mutase, partial [bacterium]|nr:2,3-bisphosphoglycerate-independent phosphoglycerate mutase [bacterium]